MSVVSWPAFLVSVPRGHLVSAVVVHVGADEIGTLQLREIRNLLKKVIDGLHPAGAWAVTLSRAAGFPEILCGFEKESDADVFAATVHAGACTRYPEWASERAFRLDGAIQTAMSAGLLSHGEIDQR